MTTYSESGLQIVVPCKTSAVLHENLINSLSTAIALIATHPEATREDREAVVHLSKLQRALTPTEKQLENGA